MTRERLVVVGNGMAGARVVQELLARGGSARYEITVLGEEPHGSYNRILLSDVLRGVREAREIFLHPRSWYAENGVTLRAPCRAVEIDRERRLVRDADGGETPYDRLILAIGSRPLVPEVPGTETPGVFVFRTLDDCRRLAEQVESSRTAVVVGGGLLGLEAAYGLLGLGLEVHLVHRHPHLMERQLDPEASAVLAAAIRGLGIRLHLGRETEAVLGEERVTSLQLEEGDVLPADLVVFACGIRPNVEAAAAAGLAVGRGILVDDQLRSVTDPRIFAVGECAEHGGIVHGLVAPAWEQARVLAEALVGNERAAYAGSRVSTRLKVAGLDVTAMGAVLPDLERDEVVQFLEPRRGIYKKLVIRDGRLAGAILLGDAARAPHLIQAFERAAPLPDERAALLFDLGGGAGALSLAEMEDDATVCHCNGVSKGDLLECLAGGACGLHAVMQATRAGTGCGSCKTLVKALVDRGLRETRELPVTLGAAS
ncbi:MAG: FAD-dependent oxidoreductase [Armatimonadota bacterium]